MLTRQYQIHCCQLPAYPQCGKASYFPAPRMSYKKVRVLTKKFLDINKVNIDFMNNNFFRANVRNESPVRLKSVAESLPFVHSITRINRKLCVIRSTHINTKEHVYTCIWVLICNTKHTIL